VEHHCGQTELGERVEQKDGIGAAGNGYAKRLGDAEFPQRCCDLIEQEPLCAN
jgi:hypothetical protein